MNSKTISLSVLAAALMLGAGAANAKSVSLADSIHLQMRDAGARIEADMRANVKAMPRLLDVPGVEIGEVELAESKPAKAERGTVRPETAAVELDEILRRDLVDKALEVPGMFGVYRYMAASALTVAIIVAE